MGTNFYTLKNVHIGKRSAAGKYCFDCNITLCKAGNEGIHFCANDGNWYEACPKCGKKYKRESLDNSSAGVELGFNKNPTAKKTGVSSCSSWSWAMEPTKYHNSKIKFIKDEYHRRFTRAEFDEILEACPVEYTRMVGQEFS